MKADGTLDEIIKKWTSEASTANSAVPTTTTPAGQKATPKKAKYIISSDSSLHHLSSKMEKQIHRDRYGLDQGYCQRPRFDHRN